MSRVLYRSALPRVARSSVRVVGVRERVLPRAEREYVFVCMYTPPPHDLSCTDLKNGSRVTQRRSRQRLPREYYGPRPASTLEEGGQPVAVGCRDR